MRRAIVSGEPPADTNRPPPEGDGTTVDPFEVLTLPMAHWRDTRIHGSSVIERYDGCDAPQDEGGRELVYRLVVGAPIDVRVLAIGEGDVDVHLLRGEASGERCVARDDRELVHHLEPGVWFVSVDTFAGEDGPDAGEVLVLIAPAPAPPATRAAEASAAETRAAETRAAETEASAPDPDPAHIEAELSVE